MEVTADSTARTDRNRTSFKSDSNGKVPSFSLVMPAYNESAGIAHAIQEADEALSKITSDYEIIIVDDGSLDDTANIAERASLKFPSVRVLRAEKNVGYGAAIQRGFQAATKDVVGFTDADCQFELSELAQMIPLTKHYDLVCGYRIDRQDPWLRKVYSAGYNSIVRLLLGTRVRDCDCALKIFRREVIQSIPMNSKGFFFNSELLAQARMMNYSFVELGVTHRPRVRGTSTVSIKQILPVSKSIVNFWWNKVLFANNELPAELGLKRWSLGQQLLGILLLIVISAIVLLPNLNYPLFEPDETRYTHIALEMLEQGDWVTPRLRGEAYLDKPPLLYWMSALSMQTFGPSPAAARLPSIISAFLTVLLTYVLGKRLIGDQPAWYGALALVLSGGFMLSGRFLLMDSLLTLWTTVALLAGVIALCTPNFSKRWWIVASIACALGVLTKGPLALVLCVPPLLAYQLLTKTHRRLILKQYAFFVLPSLLITLPWFIAVAQANPNFSAHFFWQHHFVRFTNAFNHREPWWYYIPMVFVGMFPASLLIPPTLAFVLGRNTQNQRLRTRNLGFLFVGTVWPIFFFSLSTCKLPTYILPSIPMFSLLIGFMVSCTVLKPQFENSITRFLKPFPQRAVMIVVVALVVVAIVGLRFEEGRSVGTAVAFAIAVGIAGIAYRYWNSPQAFAPRSWAFSAAVGLAVSCYVFGKFIPDFATERSVLHQIATLRAENNNRQVVFLGQPPLATSLHVPQSDYVSFSEADIEQFWNHVANRGECIVVTPADRTEVADLAGSHEVRLSPADKQGRTFVAFSLRPLSTDSTIQR